MGARIGEDVDSTNLNLPQFEGKEPNQIADDMAAHFASILQQFEPVDVNRLPREIRNEISDFKIEEMPTITEERVANLILKTSNTKRGTKGDIPPALIKASLPATNGVITNLFNKIAVTGKWPER